MPRWQPLFSWSLHWAGQVWEGALGTPEDWQVALQESLMDESEAPRRLCLRWKVKVRNGTTSLVPPALFYCNLFWERHGSKANVSSRVFLSPFKDCLSLIHLLCFYMPSMAFDNGIADWGGILRWITHSPHVKDWLFLLLMDFVAVCLHILDGLRSLLTLTIISHKAICKPHEMPVFELIKAKKWRFILVNVTQEIFLTV